MAHPNRKTGKNMVPLYKRLKKEDIKEFITCEICGKKIKYLGNHVIRTHGMSCSEYKELYPETRFFISDDIRVRTSYKRDRFLRTKNRYLTEDEIEFIKENYGKISIVEISRQLELAMSTVNSCIEKYCSDRIRKFKILTPEDIEYIRENFNEKTNREMAEHIGSAPQTIMDKLREFNFVRDQKKAKNQYGIFYPDGAPSPLCNEGKLWNNEEIEYLQKNYKTETAEEIAAFLGRSVSGIKHRLVRDKLKSDKFWREDEIEFLVTNYQKYTNPELAKILGRPFNGVVDKALNLRLKKK